MRISSRAALLRLPLLRSQLRYFRHLNGVLAENTVRAAQAAWWYSLRMPPSRCRRWMSRSVTWAWFVVGCGSGRSGRALAILWWGRWVL